MARGQVFTQPNQTGQIIETTSREEMNSVAILNPNDGVVYLKLNGPAGSTPSQWDWKLPSQSYGLFPGPWVSLGVYYLDQSGSGRSGELNVYDATDKLYTPYIVAIGRAVQSAGTTVDISQGTQPQNPPASSARLWVDGTGHLHVLQSNGSDFLTIDANNYPSVITLVGDVNGPVQTNVIANNAVTTNKIANGSITSAKINPNTLDLRPQGLLASDITADRGNGTGVIYLDNTTNHYLYWNGTTYLFGNPVGSISAGQVGCTSLVDSGNATITGGTIALNDVSISRWNATQLRIYGGGGLTLVGTLSLENAGILIPYNTSIAWGSSSNTSIYVDTGQMQFAHTGYFRFYNAANGHYGDIQMNLLTNGAHAFQFSTSAYVNTGLGFVVGGNNLNGQSFFVAGGAGGPTGWQTISTQRFKGDISVIEDALQLVMSPSLHGYHYTKDVPPEILYGNIVDAKTPLIDPQPEYGFIAEDWSLVAPDVVTFNESGDAHMMDYQQVNTILFQAFKQYVDQTDKALDKLDKRVEKLEGNVIG